MVHFPSVCHVLFRKPWEWFIFHLYVMCSSGGHGVDPFSIRMSCALQEATGLIHFPSVCHVLFRRPQGWSIFHPFVMCSSGGHGVDPFSIRMSCALQEAMRLIHFPSICHVLFRRPWSWSRKPRWRNAAPTLRTPGSANSCRWSAMCHPHPYCCVAPTEPWSSARRPSCPCQGKRSV